MYFSCEAYTCRCRIGVGCFRELVGAAKRAVKEMKKEEELDDPTGFWSAVINGEHESALAGVAGGSIFTPRSASSPPKMKLCFFCEDVKFGEPPQRATEEMRTEPRARGPRGPHERVGPRVAQGPRPD